MLIFTVFLKKKIYAFEKSYICFTMQITIASQLSGVFPAIFTPLCSDDPKNLRNSVDFKKMGQMIAKQKSPEEIGAVIDNAYYSGEITLEEAQHLLTYVDGVIDGGVIALLTALMPD